jgi:hypothetical protein
MANVPETDFDEQDLAEVFDEDNTNTESQRRGGEDAEQAEDLVDLFDVTKAVGDADDDQALIGEDLDDEEIIGLAREEDGEDDEVDDEETLRDSNGIEDERDAVADLDDEDEDVVDGIDMAPPEDVDLSFVGDMNDIAGAHSAAQRYESKTLSDDDLKALDYKKG